MFFQEKRQFVIGIIAVGLVAGFVLFVFLPLRSSKKAVQRQIKQQQKFVAEAKNKGEFVPELREKLSLLEEVTSDFEVRIPSTREMGEFLQRIAAIMNEHNLVDQEVQPGTETEIDGYRCMPVTMKCKGRLNQIFEFYKSMSVSNRLLRIVEVRLVNTNDYSGQIDMQAKGMIYYQSGDSN